MRKKERRKLLTELFHRAEERKLKHRGMNMRELSSFSYIVLRENQEVIIRAVIIIKMVTIIIMIIMIIVIII